MNDSRCQIDSPATLKEALRLIHDLQNRLIQLESQNEDLLRDINTRQQVKQTLHHYECIMAATPDAVALLDRNYVYLVVNDEYSKRTGRPRETIVGCSVGEVMGEEVFQTLVKAKLDRCLAGERVQYQSWLDSVAKGRRFFDVTYTPYRDETGAVAGVVVNACDVTDLKRVETVLRQTQERLELAVEGAHLGLYDANMQTGQTEVNAHYLRMRGFAPGETTLTVQSWLGAIHPDDRPRIARITEECTRDQRDLFEAEYRVRHRSGEWVWILDRGKGFDRDETGQPRRAAGICIDITERKQAEERLRESETKLHTIFRAAPIGLGLTVDRVIREVNQTTCQLLGYTREELIGKNARLLYTSQADFDFVGTEKYRQIRDRGVGTVETRWRRKDGTVLDILLSSTAIDPGDLAKGVSFSAMDITERKRIEAELRQSEQRFRALVDLLPCGVQENDAEGRITFANPALERLHGLRENGVVGRFIWDFLADAAAREELRNYLQFLVREQPAPVTYFSKNRRADGAVIDVQIDWSYNRDQQGRVQGFIAVITDITERQRMQQQLQLNQFSTDEAALAIFWLDNKDRFLYANTQACRSLGYSLAELRTMRVWDIDPEFPEACSEPFWQEIRQKKVARFESIHRRKDGSIFPVELSVRYAAYQGKEYNFAFAQNITERRRVEQRLVESTQRLQQLSRRLLSVQEEERRALARELHDDFGQQLTALKLNLAMLERDLRDPAHQARLADCINIVESARESIQNTARQLRPAILDDLGLVEALHWYARSQAERSGCTIEIQDRLPMLLPPEVETAVFRIVQEAVNNALRHGQSRRIDITTGVDQRELTLVIQDDGVGFDPDTRAAAKNPSGLGLISMSERTTLLGGRFSFASRPGAGVRIEAAIPLAEERA